VSAELTDDDNRIAALLEKTAPQIPLIVVPNKIDLVNKEISQTDSEDFYGIDSEIRILENVITFCHFDCIHP
jgi:GTPase SAR1 family protein